MNTCVYLLFATFDVLFFYYRIFQLRVTVTCLHRNITMKPGIVADEMFPEGNSAIMDMDDEVH